MKVGVTSQVNPQSLPTLEALAEELQDAGAMGWQWQLTLPVGRAAGQAHLAMTQEQMPELYRLLQRMTKRQGLRPHITDNIGYCTEDDAILRTMQIRFERGIRQRLEGGGRQVRRCSPRQVVPARPRLSLYRLGLDL